jgi:hypothetical protein
MDYIHFKTGIPGILPPDCSELIPPPPIEVETKVEGPSVHGPEQIKKGVLTTKHKRRMMPCNKKE